MAYGTLNVGAMTPGSGATLTISETVKFTGDLNPSTALSNRNRLINGDFQVAQRATSFVASANNDDTYNLDRWYLLSDGNDIVDVTQSSTAPTNQLTSIGLDVETANKKFGIAQIIESNNCVGLIGNNVTLSFKAKVSDTSKLDNVKAAIISWSSTVDAVTSDVVSAWAVEGTNPTLASNLTYENTPADLNLTTSWATYSVSANIDTSSTTNVVVFIWSDVTDTTAGHFLHITDCQIEQGSTATPFEHQSYGEELARCQRYYETSSVDGTFALENMYSGSVFFAQTTQTNGTFFRVVKRATPTVTIYSRNGTVNKVSLVNTGADQGGTASSGDYWSINGFKYVSIGDVATAGNGVEWGYKAEAEL
tara:strand:+ start:147 stop:1241 length:1095 start_codon:yes stop_codon:yes gene_type:complete